MGTSKHVIVLLTMTLGGLLAAGQDKPAASAPSAQPKASNTRFASCMVRITADPAIMPLSLENIESLLQSSGVAVKAGREVLGLNEMEVFNLPLFKVEWLNASPAPLPPGARSSRPAETRGYDEEMLRQLEQVYGRDFVQRAVSGEQRKSGAKESRPAESLPREGASGASGQSRSGDTGTEGPAGGTAVGGMGMAGGMGMGGGAFPAQEPSTTPSRVPGESDVAYRTRVSQLRAVQQAQRAQQAGRSIGNRGMGMGGGMMGGYGGMSFYGVPGSAQQGERMEQSATVKVIVEMPGNVPPRADEFLGAVVTNLRESLRQAYESCRADIEYMLVDAKTQYQFVESRLDSTTGAIPPATARIKKQLDTEVDLSELSGQPPLATAFEILRKSVEPPLNIVVLWKDVQTNLSVEASSPINVDGSPKIRLGTALDLLVKGLYNGSARPMWRIQDDAIVIGTTATLGRPREVAGQTRVEADAVNLAGQRSELTRKAQTLELDLAGLDARREAIAAQTAGIRQRVSEKLSTDPAIREFEKLSQVYSSSSGSPEEREKAIRAKIELANRREELSKQAGGAQLEEFNKELSRMAIDKAEKEAQLQIVRRQLDEVQKELAQALAFDPEAARLRLAQEALDITGRRVVELQTRIADLQPPTVIMIGAN